jgi:hypothetical protein
MNPVRESDRTGAARLARCLRGSLGHFRIPFW